MKKLIEYSPIATLFLVLVVSFQTCGTKRIAMSSEEKISEVFEISKEVLESQNAVVVILNDQFTKEDLKKVLRQNMYESLILEEDIDKKVISISEIKKMKLDDELEQ